MKNKKIDNKSTWFRILKMILGYKKYILAVILCSLILGVLYFFRPLIIQNIIDDGFVEENIEKIYIFSVILFGLAVVEFLISIFQARCLADLYNKFSFLLQEKAFEKIYRLKYSFFIEKSSNEIVGTVYQDINRIVSLVNSISIFSVVSILQIFGGLVGLSILNWKIAGIILAGIPLKYLIITRMSKTKEQLTKISVENERQYYAWLGDWINGIKEIKLWNLLEYSQNRFNKFLNKRMYYYKKGAVLDQCSTSGDTLLNNVLDSIIYIFGGILLIKNQMTIGGVLAFITYSSYILSPISFLVGMKYTFSNIKPSADRYFDFLDLPQEDLCKKKIQPVEKENFSIEFKNVNFSYDSSRKVLSDVNLKIKHGETIGIIGKNGSGKSTIIALILGLYLPDRGQVLINGVSTSNIDLEHLRDQIAVVNQPPYLFNSTILENINLGDRASDKEVESVCKKSGIDQFVYRFQKNYQYCVGSGGIKLSGGERQKVAVARALLKKANIILLDEATTGYDVDSSAEWKKRVRSEFKDKTVIMVTHKIEELEGVDSVYELCDGELYHVK